MIGQQNKTKILWLAVLVSSAVIILLWLLWLYPKSAGKISRAAESSEFSSLRDNLKKAFSVFSPKEPSGKVRGENRQKIDPQIQELRQRVFGQLDR